MSEKVTLESEIPLSAQGLRLDQALAQLFPEYSRGQLTKWIKAGDVTVDGEKRRPRDAVMGEEHVVINTILVPVEDSWEAEEIALDIVYEDSEVLIINKPNGLVVHPGAGNQSGTLVNALLNHAPQLEAIPRAGIVHRIDKGTTGLLMVAKTLTAHNSLVAQLQERTVIREYHAIVSGVLTAGGMVDEPIGRHHIDRKRMAISQTGKPAVTHYRVVERFRGHTHVTCKLETGRTHQIRVHMAHIRHPLIGDPVYGGRFKHAKGLSEAMREQIKGFGRQALHAAVLGFEHPKTGEIMQWEAPIPEDMTTILAALRADMVEDESA